MPVEEGQMTCDMVIRRTRTAKVLGSEPVNMRNVVSPYDVQHAWGGATEDETREAGNAASSFAWFVHEQRRPRGRWYTARSFLSPPTVEETRECHLGTAHSVRTSSTRTSRIEHRPSTTMATSILFSRRRCSKMYRRGPERVIASFRALRLWHFRRKFFGLAVKPAPEMRLRIYREELERITAALVWGIS